MRVALNAIVALSMLSFASYVRAAELTDVKAVLADEKAFAGKTVTSECRLPMRFSASNTTPNRYRKVDDSHLLDEPGKPVNDGGYVIAVPADAPPMTEAEVGLQLGKGAIDLRLVKEEDYTKLDQLMAAADPLGPYLVTYKLARDKNIIRRETDPATGRAVDVDFAGVFVSAKPVYHPKAPEGMADPVDVAFGVLFDPEKYEGKTVTSEVRFGGDDGSPIAKKEGAADGPENAGWTQWSRAGTREEVREPSWANDRMLYLLTPTAELKDKCRDLQGKSSGNYQTWIVTYKVGKPPVQLDSLIGTLVDLKLKE